MSKQRQTKSPIEVSVIIRFFRWWRAELWGLLPAKFKEWANTEKAAAVVSFSETATRISIPNETSEDSDTHEWNLQIPFPAVLNSTEFLQIAESKLAGPISIDFQSPLYIQRPLKLPSAARDNLNSIVNLQLDKLLPTNPSALYVDCACENSSESADQLDVAVGMLRKDFSHRAVESIEIGRGKVLKVTGSDGSTKRLFSFLSLKEQMEGQKRRALVALGGFGVVALALLAFGYNMSLNSASSNLAQKIAQTAEQAREAESLRADLLELQETKAILQASKSVHRPESVLSELSKLLPDNAWIFDYSQTADRLVITGWAPDTNAVVKLLVESASFENVTSSANVINDSAGKTKERFTITLDLASGTSS